MLWRIRFYYFRCRLSFTAARSSLLHMLLLVRSRVNVDRSNLFLYIHALYFHVSSDDHQRIADESSAGVPMCHTMSEKCIHSIMKRMTTATRTHNERTSYFLFIELSNSISKVDIPRVDSHTVCCALGAQRRRRKKNKLKDRLIRQNMNTGISVLKWNIDLRHIHPFMSSYYRLQCAYVLRKHIQMKRNVRK